MAAGGGDGAGLGLGGGSVDTCGALGGNGFICRISAVTNVQRIVVLQL